MSVVKNFIVVRLRDWSEQTAASVVEAAGCTIGKRIPPLKLLRAVVPEGADPDAALAALQAHPAVQHAYFEAVAKRPS